MDVSMPDLASADDLAVRTGRPASDPDLLLALHRASGRFRGEVHHSVTRIVNDTVELDGPDSNILLLPGIPIEGTPTVQVDGVTVTDFRVSRRNGFLKRADGWGCEPGSITVTFTHGASLIPQDVADAVLEQAETLLTSSIVIQSRTVGSESVTFGQTATAGVTQKWADTVDRYRLPKWRA